MNTAKEILRKHCEAFSRDNFGVKYDPDSKANEAILAAMTEHTDLATKALQEENRQLLEWKRQQLEVWGPVDD